MSSVSRQQGRLELEPGILSVSELQAVLEMHQVDDPSTVFFVESSKRDTSRKVVTKSKTNTDKPIYCYHCKKEGHKRPECPELKNLPKPMKRKSTASGSDVKTIQQASTPTATVSQFFKTETVSCDETMTDQEVSDREIMYFLTWEDSEMLSSVLAIRDAADYVNRNEDEVDAVLPPAQQRTMTTISIGGHTLEAQVDTGADHSFISSGLLRLLSPDTYTVSRHTAPIRLADGSLRHCKIVTVTVTQDITSLRVPMGVLDKDDVSALLGLDLITAFDIRWGHYSADKVSALLRQYQELNIETILASAEETDKSTVIHHPRKGELMVKIQDLLDKNTATLGSYCTLKPIRIQFKEPEDRAKGCWQQQFKMPLDYQQKYKQQVQKWLDEGVVEEQLDNHPRTSDKSGVENGLFNVCTIAVWSNKLRFVQNFVPLNKLLKDDTNDVPAVDEGFLKISEIRPTIYTKIDLRQAYLQLPLRETDREVTAFTCGGKRYRFITAPLGLKHIPSTFQRRIRGLLQEHGVADEVHSHLDDLFIAHRDVERHTEVVCKVLQALTSVNLTINAEKSHFFVTRVPLLGMIADTKGIRPNPQKICNMMEWKRPATRRQIQQFLGIINFFRRYIPNVSGKTEIFFKAMKEKTFIWNEEMERCYTEIASALLSGKAFLHFPDLNHPLRLDVDASKTSIGGILYQIIDDEVRVIGFNSRILVEGERNYTIPKRELLSAVYHIEYWRHWLTGRHFHLRMDNKGMQQLLKLGAREHHNSTASAWATTLGKYRFDVTHVDGKENSLADMASRVQMARKATRSEDEIARILHETHALGHFGAVVMEHHISVTRNITDIPRLKDRCAEFTKSCPVCRRVNTHRIGYAPLENPKFYTPNQRWHTDLLEMPKSISGNEYTLVVIDDLTRYCWLTALPSKSADIVANALVHLMLSNGFPGAIKTDEGGEYANTLMQAIEDAAGILHQFVPAHNYHGLGVVERHNRTTRDVILRLVVEAGGTSERWDEVLAHAQFYLNIRFHTGIHAVPFTLMHGRAPFAVAGEGFLKPPEPEVLTDEIEDLDKSANPHVKRLSAFWKTLRGAVLPRIHRAQVAKLDKRKAQYRRKTSRYKVGDYVMYRDPHVTSKMVPKNKGPFRITAPIKNGSYMISGHDGKFHAPANFLHRTILRDGDKLASIDLSDKSDTDDEERITETSDDGRDKDFQMSQSSQDRNIAHNKPRRSTRKNRTAITVGTGEHTKSFPARG